MGNNLDTNMLKGVYEPVMVLVIHSSSGDFYHGSNYYVETAPTIRGDGKYAVGEYSPISENAFKRLVAIGMTDNKIKPKKKIVFPEQILSYSEMGEEAGVIWYLVKPKRMLFFAKNMHIPDRPAELPSMIFKWDGGLNVWFYEGTGRPGMETDLYHAPFFNTSGDGRVCLGDAKVKQSHETIQHLIEDVETAFFASKFTSTMLNVAGPKLWTEAVKTGKLDLSKCKKSKHKLKDIIK